MLTRSIPIVVCAIAGGCGQAEEACVSICERGGPDVLAYHGTSGLGWNSDAGFADLRGIQDTEPLWSSDPFPEIVVGDARYPTLMYASVLLANDVALTAGPYAGSHLSLAIAATTSGTVHAINAFDGSCDDCRIEGGRTVWEAELGEPVFVERLDGGLPLGVLGTPVIDTLAPAPTLYVASLDARAGWQVHALALGSGEPLPDWPVTIDDAALAAVNRNGPARFQAAEQMSQRGALALAPDGGRVYVTFGTYWGEGVGWLVAIDTASASVVDAFSSAPELDAVSSGGIWGSAGPAIDDNGDVYVTTGNAPPGSEDTTNVWGNSLLRFDARLRLLGSYTPFNYCRLDAADLDLAGSQPILLPTLNGTTTPDTVAFGSKQGNVYLVDRAALRTSDRRPPCSLDSTADGSLVPPEPQPQFDARGPLNVFGPYSEIYGMIDQAKMRSKLAYFEDRDGARWLFATGSTKAAPASTQSVAPSIARLRIATPAGEAAYLQLEATNADVVFSNPGSPIVTSRGPDDAVVWVVDRNAARTSSTSSPDTPRPILYAFDATTLALLWRTPDDMLGPAGKYATPAATHGVVFVGTDRVQAFGTRR